MYTVLPSAYTVQSCRHTRYSPRPPAAAHAPRSLAAAHRPPSRRPPACSPQSQPAPHSLRGPAQQCFTLGDRVVASPKGAVLARPQGCGWYIPAKAPQLRLGLVGRCWYTAVWFRLSHAVGFARLPQGLPTAPGPEREGWTARTRTGRHPHVSPRGREALLRDETLPLLCESCRPCPQSCSKFICSRH